MRKAVIRIADNMSSDTYKLLCNGLTAKFGSDIEFEKITDNSVIGGFVLNLDGMVYDSSVSAQINRLKKHLS